MPVDFLPMDLCGKKPLTICFIKDLHTCGMKIFSFYLL